MDWERKNPPAGGHRGASKLHYNNIISIFSARQDQSGFTHIHVLTERIVSNWRKDLRDQGVSL